MRIFREEKTRQQTGEKEWYNKKWKKRNHFVWQTIREARGGKRDRRESALFANMLLACARDKMSKSLQMLEFWGRNWIFSHFCFLPDFEKINKEKERNGEERKQ